MNERPSWRLMLAVVAACLAPTFLFAKHIDGDEWLKSGTGVATVGAIVTIWRTWIGARAKR